MIAPSTAAYSQLVKETFSLNLFKQTQDANKVQAQTMIQDFSQNQQKIQQASHPTLGKHLDVRV